MAGFIHGEESNKFENGLGNYVTLYMLFLPLHDFKATLRKFDHDPQLQCHAKQQFW